ncbi:adenylate kinase 7 [Megachile rotundata]|uniref:adenylate kinase 7 n=1 Tax=Megachile rotundata TaxID=143995 RepID=UPI003FD484E3
MTTSDKTSLRQRVHHDGVTSIEGGEQISQRSKEVLEESDVSFKPWRVFINHVDSYHGKKLVELLSDRVYVNPRSEDLFGGEEEEMEEEEIEEEEEGFRAGKPRTPETPKQYEIIGTAMDPEYIKPEDVTMIVKDFGNRDAFLTELMKCGVVVYDITENADQIDEAIWTLKAITRELENMEVMTPKAFKRSDEVRYFVLISTLMTWANTKPLNPEEPELPFTEDDYRKRKPHPNFKRHVQCEKEVVMAKKKTKLTDKLKTLVICCGITYGDEQGPLHYLFKMAWQNAPFLPVLGEGNNKIPLLHVRDLTTVVLNVLQEWPPKRYIIAAEQEPISQKTIVKKISRALSNGKIKKLPQEEAFLLPEMTQRFYDVMTMNLVVDPVYIADRISWLHDVPLRENMNTIVREYRTARGLHPVKIIVLGPPAAGKTRVAEYLSKHYDVHYVYVKPLIKEMIDGLTKEIEEITASTRNEGEEGAGDEEEEEADDEDPTNVEELQELLDEIGRNMQRNKGRIDDALLNRLFLRKLRSKECQNQGYILDGYPKTLEQARGLFGGENLNETIEEEIEGETETGETTGYTIMPELVVSLEASDDFLKERIIQRPEREIQGTHYTEEHMIRRLKEFRKRNTDDNNPMQFFDEIEIHTLVIDVEDDVCPDMFPTVYQCIEKIGPPRNYGLTGQQAIDARKRVEEERRAAELAARLREEEEFNERKKQREEKMAEWTSLMEKLKEEEEERLSVLGLPLRNYLVKYIFPTLTEGLIEVANLRPDDPIDFLAEYLFKQNPEGKMFEPDYSETMTSVLDVIEEFQGKLLPPEKLSKKISELLKQRSKYPTDGSSSSISDVCTTIKTTVCVTPSFTYDDTDTYEKVEEETTSDKSDY